VHEIPPDILRVVMLKDGKVFQDGTPEEILTSEKLSQLFDYPVDVVSLRGVIHVFPQTGDEHRGSL